MSRAHVVMFAAALLVSDPVLAQSPPSLALDDPAALTPDQDRIRHGVNATHEACLAEADTETLTGDARHRAVQSCYWRHRNECVREAASEGLPLGAESRDFVRDCLVRGP